MSDIIKGVKDRVNKGWSLGKKLLTYMCVWGLAFSLVTIGRLKVGFDYDDTLVFSTPAFDKAFHSGAQPFSPQFWSVVNKSYELERPKLVANALAWTFRLFGFRVSIVSARPPYDGDALKKEWRRLASQFVFAGDPGAKHAVLAQGNYVLFFGDSDSDIAQGRLARVTSVRIKRSPKSSYKEDYHPGSLRELVIPFSEY